MSLNPDSSSSGTVAAKSVSSRSVALDFLRFAAAALVVIFHYQSEGPFPLETLSPVFLRGYLVTDLFLILSGYVLGRAYGRQVATATISDHRFLVRRIMRIWPAHLAMMIAFAAAILAASLAGRAPEHSDAFVWAEWPAQAVLIHAWSGHGGGWNLPSWTLSALVVCYAAFPTLWRRLRGVGDGALLFVGGMGVIWLVDLAVSRAYGQTIYDLHFNLGLIRAIPMFIFGMCIARAAECGWPRRDWAPGLALTAGTLVIVLQGMGRYDLLSVALLGLLIAGCGEMRMKWGSDLAARAARISFALYITHIFVGMLWFNAERALVGHLNPPDWEQWIFWACSLPIALATAILFDRLVDQPLQRGAGWLLSGAMVFPAALRLLPNRKSVELQAP